MHFKKTDSLRGYGIHYRKTLHLAYPVVLSLAGQMMVGIVDNIMVGRLGTTPLAAAAFANGVFTNVLIFGIGFAFGLTPLVGAAYGEKNYVKAGQYLRHGLAANVGVALMLSLLCLAAIPLLPKLGQAPEVVEESLPYFGTLIFSLLPLIVFLTFKQFTEGLASTKPTMVITLLSNLLNIGLNYILIYGKLGFAPMGLLGAGYATLISRVIMAVAMAAFVFRTPLFRPCIQHWLTGGWQRPMLQKVFDLGIPSGTQIFLEAASFNVGTIMMGWIGKTELAAHQIVLSIASLTYMMASGISAAATIRVSNQLGQRDYHTLKQAAYSAIHMAIAFMLVTAFLFVALRGILPQLFIDEPKVIAVAASLMVVAAFFQLFDGVQVVAIGALRGLSDVKVPMLVCLLAYWGLGLPTGYFLAFFTPLREIGIWIGFLTGLTAASVMFLFRFERKANQMIGAVSHHASEGVA